MSISSKKLQYQTYNDALSSFAKPLAFVDLDLLDKNIEAILQRNRLQKNIRIATKSIRCTYILNYILSKNEVFKGLMAYDAREAATLSKQGFDDILIAYPEINAAKISTCIHEIFKRKNITFMIDKMQHLQVLEQLALENSCNINVCIDVDLSSKFPLLYFGVYRSSIKTEQDILSIIQAIKKSQQIQLAGIMGYEAQIAGLGDNFPNEFLKNVIVKFLKKKSCKDISNKRAKIHQILQQENIELSFHNGGGTGSIESTEKDIGITEITVGSGFYQSHLFDNYSNFTHFPAAGFALQVTRKPQANIVTCNGGGYIASGATSLHKQPKPYLPEGLKLINDEGCGEVQTPLLINDSHQIEIGDSVFFRHAKAGELCEHFNELHLIRNRKVVDTVKTYRGEGLKYL